MDHVAGSACDPTDEWRFQVIENYLRGIYKNTPVLAKVDALLDSTIVTSQVEMAEILGRSEMTIAEQVSDVD